MIEPLDLFFIQFKQLFERDFTIIFEIFCHVDSTEPTTAQHLSGLVAVYDLSEAQ